MRWLIFILLISLVMLLLVAGAVVQHVRRQRQGQPSDTSKAREGSEEIRRGDS